MSPAQARVIQFRGKSQSAIERLGHAQYKCRPDSQHFLFLESFRIYLWNQVKSYLAALKQTRTVSSKQSSNVARLTAGRIQLNVTNPKRPLSCVLPNIPRNYFCAHKQVVALNSEMHDKIMEHFLSGEEIGSEDRKSIFLYNIGEAPNNASVYEEENICKLAKAFFIATTKQSADDEDILPQVHNTTTLLLFFKADNDSFFRKTERMPSYLSFICFVSFSPRSHHFEVVSFCTRNFLF